MSTQLPPAISDSQPPQWVAKPASDEGVFDVWIVKAGDYEAFQHQYGYPPPAQVNVLAVTYLKTDDSVIKEDYWPRACRPGAAPGGEGYLRSTQLPYLFSNALQEGVFLHECLGHGVHGSVHEGNVDPTYHGQNHPSPDPCMWSPEQLPADQRLALISEFASHYPLLHVHAWTPGAQVLADNDKAS